MPIDLITSVTSSDERHPSSSPQALSIQTADAIKRLHGALLAYQCIEKLAMPRSTSTADLDLSDKELYNLFAALNEPLRRQVEQAEVACHRLIECIQKNQPS